MLSHKQSNIIHTDKDDIPSRFLVDLNKPAGNDEETRDEAGLYERFCEKLANFDIGNFEKTFRSEKPFYRRAGAGFSRIFDRATAYRPESRPPAFCRALILRLKDPKIRRLAFFPLIALSAGIFFRSSGIIYRICFEAGWFGIFIIRLFFLSIAAVLKIVFKFHKCFHWAFRALVLAAGFLSAAKMPRVKEFFRRTGSVPALPRVKTREPETFDAELPDYGGIDQGARERGRLYPSGVLRRFGIKKILVFSVLSLAIILPFKTYSYYKEMRGLKDRVLGASAAAIGEMAAGSKSASQRDFMGAGRNFSSAGGYFREAKDEIGEIGGILRVLGPVLPSTDMKLAANAEAVLEAGRLSAELGGVLSSAFAGLTANAPVDAKTAINEFSLLIGRAAILSARLEAELARVNAGVLPDQYREEFALLRDKAVILSGCFKELGEILAELKIFLGFEFDRRYLLVFQNNAEMRASGGFAGSFARLDLSDGKIKNLKIPGGGSYDTEGGLYERIAAPKPLSLINPLWHFWDANWWPDWSVSAAKLAWFYEHSGGPTVDGVISFTPAVMENILKVTGPVDLEERYGVVIDAENFWEVTQVFAEQKPPDHPEYAPNPYLSSANASTTETENAGKEPKKIIGDLADAIREKLSANLDENTLLGLADVFERGLLEKHILVYFRDEDEQAEISARGWGGGIDSTGWDYLMVVNTNIAGGKSDRVIEEKIDLAAEVAADGSVVNTLTVTRTHKGTRGEKFTGVRNNDWMRIYVPAGSRLIEARGFTPLDDNLFEKPDPAWRHDPDVENEERGAQIDTKTGTMIYEESGKTVFANWSEVDPGQSAVISIKYELPFTLAAADEPETLKSRIEDFFGADKKKLIPYALSAQKQPGSAGSDFSSTLILPDNYDVVWRYPADADIGARGWKITTDLSVDRYYAVLMENKD